MPKLKKGLVPLIVFVVKVGDFVILNLLLVAFHYVYEKYMPYEIQTEEKTIWVVVNLCYGFSVSLFGVRLVDRVVGIETIIRNAFYIVVFHFVLLNCSFAILNIFDVSGWMIFCFSGSMCLLLIGWRVSLRLILKSYRKKGGNLINIVIIGAGEVAEQVYEEMKADVFSGFKVLGFFDNNVKSSEIIPDYLGTLQDLPAFCNSKRIDEIYYTLPITTGQHFMPLVRFARMNIINFFVVPDFNRVLKRKIDLLFLDNIALFKFSTEPLSIKSNRIVKRVLDIVFSVLVIIFTYPLLFLILVPLIKLSSPGPILFKQERTGLKGENFVCYKFRSMTVNKDADNLQATRGDTRITRLGSFLRKTNLDEMPQFINVIKGDMSVVGPRPHMIKHTEEYSRLIDRYMFRHLVKPGVTGWAQVTGFRGETKDLKQMEGRVEKDVWYIENWSILLDIKIILNTVINAVIGDDNAF